MELSRDLHSNSNLSRQETVVDHLRMVVEDYLARRPHLSVNGISKKCNVSEPTLRRIMSGKVKTIPKTTTILDILSYILNTTSVREIVNSYPGPIAEFLQDAMPFIVEFDQEYSNIINEELQDPIKYLIYKLAVNTGGVREDKVTQLYGTHGLQLLQDMMEKGFIEQKDAGVFQAKATSFKSSNDQFVKNFKAVADFIKPNKFRSRKPLNPFFVNCSESLSPEAYEKILRIQKKSQKKIREVLVEGESKGSIPFFYLCAIDTLDLKAAWELTETSS